MIQSRLVVFLNIPHQVAVQQEQRIPWRTRYHGKFITTNSKAVPPGTISLLDSIACSNNQGIARLMAKGVVCILKAVHIHEYHGPSVRLCIFLTNVVQKFIECKPVFKPRQAIRCCDILQVFVHHAQFAIHLLQFKRCFANKRRHTGCKRKPGSHSFLNVFSPHKFTLYRRTFAHRGNHQRNVVLVQVALFTQEFAVREKSRAGGKSLERRDFVCRFTLCPESLSCRTRENMLHLRSKLFASLTFGLDLFDNQSGFAIREANNGAFVNIRRHRERTIRVAGARGTYNRDSVVFIEHRKFERVIEEILVVLDTQILVINFVSGNAAEFIKNVSFSTGHMEVTANGFPATNLAGIHIEFITAIEHHQKARFGIATHRRKHAGIWARDIGRANNAAKDLNIAGQALEAIAKSRCRERCNAMINFYCLDPRIQIRLLHDFTCNAANRFSRKIILGHENLACRLFKNNSRYRNIGTQFAVYDVSTGRIAEPRNFRENSFQNIPNRFQLFGFQYGRMDLETHGGRTMFFIPLAKQEKFIFELDCVLKSKNSILHIFPS